MARVYQTDLMGEAHLKVAIVQARGMADLLVHRVDSWGLARGDALWFITRNKQEATVWIHTCSLGMADVRVCFVDGFSEAGWVHPHRCQGRFGP